MNKENSPQKYPPEQFSGLNVNPTLKSELSAEEVIIVTPVKLQILRITLILMVIGLFVFSRSPYGEFLREFCRRLFN